MQRSKRKYWAAESAAVTIQLKRFKKSFKSLDVCTLTQHLHMDMVGSTDQSFAVELAWTYTHV